ncbi:unnamed protein product [Musa banksii]
MAGRPITRWAPARNPIQRVHGPGADPSGGWIRHRRRRPGIGASCWRRGRRGTRGGGGRRGPRARRWGNGDRRRSGATACPCHSSEAGSPAPGGGPGTAPRRCRRPDRAGSTGAPPS